MLKALATLVGAALLVLVGFGSYVYFTHVAYAGPTEEVSFPSGNLTLGALLIQPSVPGPHPAIIWLHGSGPETRADPVRRVAANALVRTGYAVLLFDKRGVGASEGDFDSALYPDFIADGKAAVEYVASRPDIDPARVGLYGVSEGAWFAPQIAVDTGKVAFIFHKVGTPM